MSTVITAAPTAAGNLDIFVQNAAAWTNTANAIVQDTVYATNTFGNSSTPGITKFLYLNGFNFDLPSSAVIEGFVANIDRRAYGTVNDYYIGLVYITSPTSSLYVTQQVNPNGSPAWPPLDGIMAYGSPTNTWNIGFDWSPDVNINNAWFGLAISAQGNGAAGVQALVNSATLTIYYHLNEFVVGTGGSVAGGTADVTCVYNSNSPTSEPSSLSGKVLAGGIAYPGYGMEGSGGAVTDGSAIGDTDIPFVMTGGALLENSAVVQVTYAASITGNGGVGGGAASPDGIVYTQTTTGVGGVGGGTANVSAGYYVVGSSGAVVFIEVDPWDTFGGSGGAIGGSTAIVVETDNVTGSGGAVGEGSAIQTDIINQSLVSAGVVGGGNVPQGITGYTTGQGSVANGSGEIGITVPIAAAGAICNGTAVVYLSFVPPITSTGVVANGIAPNTLFSANLLVPSGVLAGGNGIIGIQPSVGGGAKGGGEIGLLFEYSPTVTGEAICGQGTTYILQQVYNSLSPKGGAKVSTRLGAIYEKLSSPRKEVHLDYALAMADPNILSLPKTKGSELLDPHSQTMPVLGSSRYVIQHTPGWCDFGDPCDSAYLPKVVQKRQRQYLPPKTGGDSSGSDQLATATI